MNYTSIKKISITTILATLACGAAMAQNMKVAPGRSAVVPLRMPDAITAGAPFGTNLVLDACTGCNYDSVAGGYYVWGVNNCESPGTTQWIAVPFWASKSGTPRRISASINLDNLCTSTGNQVTLSIFDDSCPGGVGTQSVPGAVLASGRAVVPAAPCALAVASIRTTATLTQGNKYWVVATTQGATQDGLSGIWYASNQSLIGGNVANGGWFSFSGLVPGFQVD
jgi:hypothetical protein